MSEIQFNSRVFCTHLDASKIDSNVLVCGWIDTIRDHGHLLFVHLRDKSGIIQLVFDPEKHPISYSKAGKLRNEYVIAIEGNISKRSDDTINPNLATGDIELLVDKCHVLSESDTPPFMITEKEHHEEDDTEGYFNVDEDIRLTYRYLDLRRRSMQQNIISRAKITHAIRNYLVERDFLDVETPVLTKSTPEGARDYLVPSRTHEGKFYALPQSPQLFKQLLMVSGFERYYQIVKCFRDEDLRPNRQPEFTQLDLEASFIDESGIHDLIEGLIVELFAKFDIKLHHPFPHITYDEAMNTYGTDRPDLRFGMTFVDVTDTVKNVNYKIFQTIIGNGGIIKGINVKGQADKISKNVMQNDYAMSLIKKFGGKGMTWMKVVDGNLESNIVQFFTDEEQQQLISIMDAEDGDILTFIADTDHHLVNDVLGKWRSFIAEKQDLIPKGTFAPCWVTDFPLFEKKDGRLHSLHHPFTSPSEDVREFNSEEQLLNVKSRAYDVVINGEEIGGGSIRIHRSDVQEKIFEALGLSADEIEAKFGFFVKALQYGAPPHGGIALGIDRLVSMILGVESIREVIAFPKNRVAYCPLTQAPSEVAFDQLHELHIKTLNK